MSGSNATTSAGARLTGVSLLVAIAVLVAYAGFTWVMIGRVDISEVRWTRLAWLFSSVEAIAFGAAGALFGSSIQRERAERAEQRADQAEGDANNGRVLAEVVKNTRDRPLRPSDLERLGFEEGAVAAGVDLAEIARRLFPD